MKKLNVLIFAHECSPVLGSECAIGWNIVTRMAKYHHVTVIYAETNQRQLASYKAAIEDFIRKNGIIEGLEFIAVSQPATARFIAAVNQKILPNDKNIGFPVLYYWAYKYWQKAAFRQARSLIKDENRTFDIVHQLTGLTFREPGYGWKLQIPFIWGPCSGLSAPPFSFIRQTTAQQAGYSLFRRFSNFIQFYFSGRVIKAMKRAKQIYAVTPRDMLMIKKRNPNCDGLLDVGASGDIKSRVVCPSDGKLTLLWVGHFFPRKALDILLYAMASSDKLKQQTEAYILGEGRLSLYYRQLAQRLGIDHLMHFEGNVPHANVFEYLNKADVFIHTSILEATSVAVIEALSSGLPVICHDACGMGIAITEDSGIKIPLKSPKMSITGFKEALEYFTDYPEEVKNKSMGALKRAGELTWDIMVKKIAEDYTRIAIMK